MFAYSYSTQAQINYSNPEKVYFEGNQNNKLYFLIDQEETPLYERYYFAQLLDESLSTFNQKEIRIHNIGQKALSLVVRDSQITTFTLDFVRSKVAQIKTQITTIKANYSTDREAQEYFKTLIRK
jgi:hypothetical protein